MPHSDGFWYLIVFLILAGVVLICVSWVSYLEPQLNPNNRLETIYEPGEMKTLSSKLKSILVEEITMEGNETRITLHSERGIFGGQFTEYAILNHTNPSWLLGQTITFKIDVVKPVCNVFTIWENGSKTHVGTTEGWVENCLRKTIATPLE